SRRRAGRARRPRSFGVDPLVVRPARGAPAPLGGRLEADPHLLERAQEEVLVVLERRRILRQPDLVDEVDERLEAVVQLAPGERRAEAVVRADAEREVPPRLVAVEVEVL